MTEEVLERYEPEVGELLPSDAQLERLATGFEFTEGPVWDFRRGELVFSDIPGDAMYRYRPEEGVSVYRRPSHFSNGMTIDDDGRLVICEHRTRRVVRGDESVGFTTISEAYGGRRLNSPNDVIVAPDGSIVFTDPHYGLDERFGGPAVQEQPHRGVYRIPAGGGDPELLVDDFEAPNGLVLLPHEPVLLIDDTERGHIRRFEVDDGWRLSGGEVLASFESDVDGVLDGMKVDEHGNIYCTGPGGIFICAPSGAVLGRLRVPEVAANLAWGDADASTLYITASTSLYRIPTRVTGFVPHRQ